jgi:hypothetical protein
VGGAFLLVVVPVTTGDGPGAGQLDLFGHPTNPPTPPAIPGQRAPSRIESNDVDLMVTVAANAVRCGYLLVGAAERVYARTDADDHVARVPRYEEDAVHQLVRRRWLTLGAAHPITCGAAHLIGTAVLVPRATRDRIARWERLQRPPSWPDQHHHDRHGPPGDNPGEVVHLDDHRRRR